MDQYVIPTVTAILGVVCFILGWRSAAVKERRAASFVRLQRYALQKFIEINWKTEYQAFQEGHRQGYQQGVLQAHELELDEDART